MRKTVLILLISLVYSSLSKVSAQQISKKDSLSKILDKAFLADTNAVPLIEIPIAFNQNMLYKIRLDSIKKTVPLPYNEYVQEYIDIFSNRKTQYGKMIGLGAYYFPIFEKALASYEIPAEIKYLPIVESKMDPQAVSRVGATGMWQFMFGTAKAYGLNMNNFVDERKDPIQASYAAAAYFRDAYEELGDWLLAIAAYNCGKGNVERAIAKAGSRDFWDIRPYLPKETRNYVPAFIATVYVMNYADRHQINPASAPYSFKTDTIHVNKYVDLKDLAKAIHYEENVLFGLNPSFKKKIVNGTADSYKRVVLPKIELADYAAVFEILNNDAAVERDVILASTDDVRELRKKIVLSAPQKLPEKYIYHKVSPGQNLSTIANKYHVEVQDLKVWNKLPSLTIIPGQKLKIYSEGNESKLSIKPKAEFVTYKVKSGDTLSEIAERFDGATVSDIKKLNGLGKAKLQPGMVLKISKG